MVEIIKYQWEGSPEQYASSGIHGLRKGQMLGAGAITVNDGRMP
jgi:hypothetical protein